MRERLPNRRGSLAFEFNHEGYKYRASIGRFDDGRLAEIFLDTGLIDTPLQQNAENAAMLASLLLQHGAKVADIVHSVSGPVAVALAQAEAFS
ncbi:hypothetical protein BRADO0465 [Bradyrhizobium sp. ORS 278]|uniref:hypothetical protein n=1 Tax=Bradyrhizobium sp. (strain ORS 278) TaxID=114615 RepID=UPI00015077BC|nr:hypothetical protein [Bradyrhizobium sp. ORS 278]CAL74409.1 hypothetical protein BRADO0465 [Bradyrhizobium sp. ORS 278]